MCGKHIAVDAMAGAIQGAFGCGGRRSFDFECRKSDRSKKEVTSKGRDGKMRHVKLRVGILKSQVV